MRTERKRLYCAIYTRKSSEEGLEQSFNSLDAQREACAAFVESQLNDTDGHFRYRLFTTEDGGLTSEAVGAVVPLPLGLWTGLSALGGLGLIRRVRRRR